MDRSKDDDGLKKEVKDLKDEVKEYKNEVKTLVKTINDLLLELAKKNGVSEGKSTVLIWVWRVFGTLIMVWLLWVTGTIVYNNATIKKLEEQMQHNRDIDHGD